MEHVEIFKFYDQIYIIREKSEILSVRCDRTNASFTILVEKVKKRSIVLC